MSISEYFLWWNSMQNLIEVKTEVLPAESTDPNVHVILRFDVKNRGFQERGGPDIVFEEIRLSVGVSPNLQLAKGINIGPRQSFTYDYPCSYLDIGKVRCSVEGTISPASFLEVRGTSSGVSFEKREERTIPSYLKLLKSNGMHRWVDIIKSMSQIDSNMTREKIETDRTTLEGLIGDIQKLVIIIQFGSGGIKSRVEDVKQHKLLVEEYLAKTVAGLARLKELLLTASGSNDEINAERKKIIDRIVLEAAWVEQASADLNEKCPA